MKCIKPAAFLIFTFLVFTGIYAQSPHPQWTLQSNIYEVNVRQYSPEGNFKGFTKHLSRLKQMGVDILWFMPITPIGLKGRKMTERELGSYYSVKDYKAINPEFGTMQDWKSLVNKAHDMGFKVITDWVPNHTAPDNGWIERHTDFYVLDSAGKPMPPNPDWTDTRKLNYNNMEMQDSMIAAMKFWLTSSNIDGFRCDVAGEVPDSFWIRCIAELKTVKNVFMLAEADKPDLHEAGFDETYTWSVMSAMTDFYNKKLSLAGFDSVLNHNIARFPANAQRLYFTANHDENSWNGTEYEKYGDAAKAFAVFTQTFYQSLPLMYSGQEEPETKRIKFFVHDPIEWKTYALEPFYKILLTLRKNTPALASDASYKKVVTANDHAVFAYVREKQGSKIAVVLNLSDQPQNFTIKQTELYGKVKNVFTLKTEILGSTTVFSMKPWEYLVYKY
ncbi:MAG: alpha-amylase family glycosyl hydrolase [Ginsengibacter sp.]